MTTSRARRLSFHPARWALICVGLLIIALSPLLLNLAARTPLNWPLLGDVGDAYGATSSLLAGFALIGVAINTSLEARQARLNVEQAARDMQLQIFDMALKDESLLPCIGPDFSKQHLFTNIWVMYQRMRLQIGDGTFAEFFDIACETFRSAPGRRYWQTAGPHLKAHWTATAFDRKFVETLDAAYRHTGEQTIDLDASPTDATDNLAEQHGTDATPGPSAP